MQPMSFVITIQSVMLQKDVSVLTAKPSQIQPIIRPIQSIIVQLEMSVRARRAVRQRACVVQSEVHGIVRRINVVPRPLAILPLRVNSRPSSIILSSSVMLQMPPTPTSATKSPKPDEPQPTPTPHPSSPSEPASPIRLPSTPAPTPSLVSTVPPQTPMLPSPTTA